MKTEHITYCRICEATCGLVAEVEDDVVVSLRPDREHVVTKGYACVKGLEQHRILHSPDRLEYPMKRVGSRWTRIDWAQALEEIGNKLATLVREHGGDSVGFYLGNPISFSLLPPILASAFLQGLGSRSFFQTGSQDCNNKFVVAERMYGFPFIQPFPDVDRTDCLIMVGSNPAVSRMSFIQLPDPVNRLRAITRRGGSVWSVNPRRTETARQVGEHVFIRPDTDVYFYLSFLHEILARDAVDHARVAKYMRGFAALDAMTEPYPPERTAAITGIAPETLRAMVDAYTSAKSAALFSSTGVNQGSQGTIAFYLQEVINAITGNLDTLGGTLVGHGYVKDFPRHARRGGHTMRKDRTRVGNLPSVVDTFPAGILADEILTPGLGQLRAMVVMAGNPLLSVPNAGGKLERAMRELELLVCIDIFRNETGNLAHYLLPGTHALQRHDLPFVFQSLMGVQPKPYAQATRPVVAPKGEQRDETRILLDLVRAAGAKPFGSRAVALVLDAWMRASALPFIGEKIGFSPANMLDLASRAFGFGSFAKLVREPHGKLLTPHVGGDFLGARVVTDDGKVDLAPQDLVDATKALEIAFARERRDTGTLRLISKREATSHNSWLHNHDALGRDRKTTNFVYVNPEDARAAGVSDGELAEVTSEVGTITLPVKCTDDMMRGAVALPHGWGHASATGLTIASRTTGANVNLLASDGPEKLEAFSGMAKLNGIAVTLRRAVSATH